MRRQAHLARRSSRFLSAYSRWDEAACAALSGLGRGRLLFLHASRRLPERRLKGGTNKAQGVALNLEFGYFPLCWPPTDRLDRLFIPAPKAQQLISPGRCPISVNLFY